MALVRLCLAAVILFFFQERACCSFDGGSDGFGLAKQGQAHYLKGDFKSAVRLYTEAIKLGYTNSIVFCNRGAASARVGEFQKAFADFDEAIARGQVKLVYTNRGIAHLKNNNFEQAVKDIDQALLNGDPPIIVINRALANSKLNNIEAALRDFDLAIKANPKSDSFYRTRGYFFLINLKDYRKAIRDLDETARLNPMELDAFLGKSVAYRELGEFEDCEAELAHAERIDPKSSRLFFQKGMFYLKKHESKQSLFYFDEALRLAKERGFPSSWEPAGRHFMKGQYWYFRGKAYDVEMESNPAKDCFKNAVSEFSDAIKLQSYNPLNYEMRAAALRALGQEAEARKDDAKIQKKRSIPNAMQE